ncbi:MAG: hypothetical protein ACR2JQ_04680 [Mycobacteriales bacterium]
MRVRRAQGRLGALAAVSIIAGVLPWVVGHSWVGRILGVPFLLIGLFCAYAAYRLPKVAARVVPAAEYPLLRPGSCACGGDCRCGAPAPGQRSPDAPAKRSAPTDPPATGAPTEPSGDQTAERSVPRNSP